MLIYIQNYYGSGPVILPRNVEPFSQGRQATNQVTLMKLSAEVNFVLDSNSSALILDGFTIQLSSFLSTLAHGFSVKLVVFWLIRILKLNAWEGVTEN